MNINPNPNPNPNPSNPNPNPIMMCRSIFAIAYCNSLNKKCILRRIVEMLLFILLENFDSHTAIYIGSVIDIISLRFVKDFICSNFKE